MYKLLVDDSLESRIAKLFCVTKQIHFNVIKKEEIETIPEIKIPPDEIKYPTWLGKENKSYCKSLYTLIHYLNEKFPGPDLIPSYVRGDLDRIYNVYGIVYALLHEPDAWECFLDPASTDILSYEEPELIDVILIPILETKSDLPEHLENYLSHAKASDAYRHSQGDLCNEFTKRFKL